MRLWRSPEWDRVGTPIGHDIGARPRLSFVKIICSWSIERASDRFLRKSPIRRRLSNVSNAQIVDIPARRGKWSNPTLRGAFVHFRGLQNSHPARSSAACGTPPSSVLERLQKRVDLDGPNGRTCVRDGVRHDKPRALTHRSTGIDDVGHVPFAFVRLGANEWF
jgi:hypothetical protein